MLTIEGRQVEVELMSIPELGGPVIPGSLKRKLLDQLNWQDFIRLHCRRRNLGFSAQGCFHSSERIVCLMFRGLNGPALKTAQVFTTKISGWKHYHGLSWCQQSSLEF